MYFLSVLVNKRVLYLCHGVSEETTKQVELYVIVHTHTLTSEVILMSSDQTDVTTSHSEAFAHWSAEQMVELANSVKEIFFCFVVVTEMLFMLLSIHIAEVLLFLYVWVGTYE